MRATSMPANKNRLKFVFVAAFRLCCNSLLHIMVFDFFFSSSFRLSSVWLQTNPVGVLASRSFFVFRFFLFFSASFEYTSRVCAQFQECQSRFSGIHLGCSCNDEENRLEKRWSNQSIYRINYLSIASFTSDEYRWDWIHMTVINCSFVAFLLTDTFFPEQWTERIIFKTC